MNNASRAPAAIYGGAAKLPGRTDGCGAGTRTNLDVGVQQVR
jgi:hypothetical protein